MRGILLAVASLVALAIAVEALLPPARRRRARRGADASLLWFLLTAVVPVLAVLLLAG